MKRILGSINKKGNSRDRARPSQERAFHPDSPEGLVIREVTSFCESGGPDSPDVGDEFLHLPAIVDAAESSPSAAREAANSIQKFLGREYNQRAYAQYNALMLMRILTDNPGKTFTVNFDTKYVTTVKELLRDGQDMSVQQILRETLDYLEIEKLKENDTLGPLVDMWKKEKAKPVGRSSGGRSVSINGQMWLPLTNAESVGSRLLQAPPYNQFQQQQQQGQQRPQQNYYQRQQLPPPGLPPPDELAARIEEAKTTAKLLLQTIQSTPASEVADNELIKEFADRAQAASRSVQVYISSNNPVPDEDTMLTLIETSEQLSIATSKHQRAILQARKAMGTSPGRTPEPRPGQNMYFPPPNAPTPNPPTNYSTSLGLQPPAKIDVRVQDYAHSQPRPDQPYAQPRPDQTYSSQPLGPSRSRPISPQPASANAALDYGVADNPFADEQVLQTSYSKPPRTPSPPKSGMREQGPGRQNPPQNVNMARQSPMYGSSHPAQRSSPYNAGYQSTSSYINRQDSATNHLTMHGAHTPPQEPVADERTMGSSPISPLASGPSGIKRRMGDMHV